MTVIEVQKRVEAIREMCGDYEAAHAHEDQLHQAVLTSIANKTCADPAALALAALATQEIAFARYCA